MLRYHIVLPAYPQNQRVNFERQNDRERNNVAFSEAIHGLFRILESWENGAGGEGWDSCVSARSSLELHIGAIYSPTDYRFRSPTYKPTGEEVKTQFGQFGMRHRYSYIHLLQAAELPQVHSIHVLQLCWPTWHRRKIAPQAFIEIGVKLPNLTSMHGTLADFESGYPAIRRVYRDGLANTVNTCSFPAIKDLSLKSVHPNLANQAWRPSNLAPNSRAGDPLCVAIRRATYRMSDLSSLHVEGVVDASVLWPSGGYDLLPTRRIHSQTFWQNLTTVCIRSDMASPSGEWYFRAQGMSSSLDLVSSGEDKPWSETAMPPGYGSAENEDQAASARYRYANELLQSGRDPAVVFRLFPNEPVLGPLVKAFALACVHIPRLKSAALATTPYENLTVGEQEWRVPSYWGIYFAAPCVLSAWVFNMVGLRCPAENLHVPRLTFNTRGWHRSENLIGIFKEIERNGSTLVEVDIDLWETAEKPYEMERLQRRVATGQGGV